jgi:membrane protease YdiL (CAAX protease family)
MWQMKKNLAKFQFIIFLTLTFLLSWIPWYTGGQGFNAWGPSLGGLIVVAVVEGREGLAEMLRRLFRWKVPIKWWLAALAIPLISTFIAIGIHVLTGGESPSLRFWREEAVQAPILIVILLSPFGGAGGEEPFGWRGYAQSKLQNQSGPIWASVVIGIVWALWHLPEFFNPTSTQYAAGIGFIVPMTVVWIAASVIMTWLYNMTGGSVLVSGVFFHLVLDFSSTTLLADYTMSGMTEGIAPLDLRLLTTFIIVVAITAISLSVFTKGKLGYHSINRGTKQQDIEPERS